MASNRRRDKGWSSREADYRKAFCRPVPMIHPLFMSTMTRGQKSVGQWACHEKPSVYSH